MNIKSLGVVTVMKQGIERDVQTENGPLNKKKQHPRQTQMTHGGIKTLINKNEKRENDCKKPFEE